MFELSISSITNPILFKHIIKTHIWRYVKVLHDEAVSLVKKMKKSDAKLVKFITKQAEERSLLSPIEITEVDDDVEAVPGAGG